MCALVHEERSDAGYVIGEVLYERMEVQRLFVARKSSPACGGRVKSGRT
jgi:hypothetical protein